MNTPLVSALTEYISRNPVPFHMPGHKGGKLLPSFLTSFLPQIDLTEVPGLDNLQAPEGVIREAQELAARVFHSDACFFLVNGSTSGIHIMMISAFHPGDKVLIPRNCHKSVWTGLILCGAEPVYIQPEFDTDRGLVTHIALDEVERAVKENPDAAGMLLVNPDYYGFCPHLGKISDILKSYGMKMLVDEAHGSHLIFHPDLPPSAAQCNADMWVHSAHKTLPALTQSAYLHVRLGRNSISKDRIVQVHRMMQSTSPSYLLMASLDWARAYMDEYGKRELDRLQDNLLWTRRMLSSLGLDSMEGYKRPEISSIDPTRLVVDVSGLGFTGYEAEVILRGAGIQAEMSDLHRVVFICSVADQKQDFELLVSACRFLSQQAGNGEKISRKLTISREIPKQMLSPKEAFERRKEYVKLKDSIGQICGELVGTYPPGIPRYCPGELIDRQGIEELLENMAHGAQMFGLSGDSMIPVIAE